MLCTDALARRYDTHRVVSFRMMFLASLQLDFMKSLYSSKVRDQTADLAFVCDVECPNIRPFQQNIVLLLVLIRFACSLSDENLEP